jgi:hypothetical protein
MTRCKSAENIGRSKQVITKFTIPEEPELPPEEPPKIFNEAIAQTELELKEAEV